MIVLAALFVLLFDGDGDDVFTKAAPGAVSVGMSSDELGSLAKPDPASPSSGGGAGGGSQPQTWFEYVPVTACPGNTPSDPDRFQCARALTACDEVPGSSGPLSAVYRRQQPGNHPWELVGETCFTSQVPARTGSPAPRQLTLVDVQRAFQQLPLAKPGMVSMPPATSGLVRLPVYFQVAWPARGYQPAEVAEVRLLGHRVRMTPRVTQVTYSFGDGSTLGPTTDLGGPYPTGGVTHPYARAGTYTTVANVVYTATFTVDAGTPQGLGTTVPIPGTPVPLTIHTATNVLIR